MKLHEYVPLALRTESPLIFGTNQKVSRLLHCAMGICTETAELVGHTSTLNLMEEMGDLAWYWAIGSDAIGFKVPECFRPLASGSLTYSIIQDDLVMAAGDLLDHLKKAAFYGKPIDEGAVTGKLCKILGSLIELCDDQGFELSDVLEANIRKLTKRYPDRFTAAAALNRDLGAEAKALENN